MYAFYFGDLSSTVSTSEHSPDTIELEAKFAVLNTANSNSCGGTFDFVDGKLEGEVFGDDAVNYKDLDHIKAATYSEMYIRQKKDKSWEAQVVLDV